MERRKKVGGIVDRRFGENDPTMTPDERALQRFVKEQERGKKKGSLFDLEDDEGEMEGLTHLGRSLGLGDGDDFNESDLSGSENGGIEEESALRAQKRRRLSEGNEDSILDNVGGDTAGRPKTKQEVMKEVIAKSKLYKYERQKAKEDDDELRAELDQGLQDIYTLLRGKSPVEAQVPEEKPAETQIDPGRLALLEGKNRDEADKEYDARLRQLALDARSQPAARTKTEEEKATEEAEQLKKLEEQRLRRMRGDDVDNKPSGEPGGDDDIVDEFGLGSGIPVQAATQPLDVEDEDDFILDDNLIASDSEAEALLDSSSSGYESGVGNDDDDEFIADLITKEDAGRTDLRLPQTSIFTASGISKASGLAFTYPCPQTHDELLQITRNLPLSDLPTVIQRIRALYHPKLNSTNKGLLAIFSTVLVTHIAYLVNQAPRPSFRIVESVIRHVHSLAKTFPFEVGTAFRGHLRNMQERPLDFSASDLIIFTAIGTMFPTSDHFHQVVTPAILTMARFLGQKVPRSLADLVKGLYLCTLCVDHQHLSKRYIPEVVNYVHTTLAFLAPVKPPSFGSHPKHDSSDKLRLGSTKRSSSAARVLQFWDIEHIESADDEDIKSSVLRAAVGLLQIMSELWEGRTAYLEIFEPFASALQHYQSKSCRKMLSMVDLV